VQVDKYLILLIFGTWVCLLVGCNSQEAALYDDFNSNSIQAELWQPRVTGNLSNLEIIEQALIATAINVPEGETGRAGLNFVNPNFEAFQADVRILSFQGTEKSRVRLEGYAYNTNLRLDQSKKGEIVFYLHLRTTGQVGYLIERCDDVDCETRTTIANDTIATVDPNDQHTLAMGFSGSQAYFRLDDRKTITVNVTDNYPVGTSGWGYAGVRARSKTASESVTAEIDNVRTGTIEEVFGS
jgi:hypothetical protein